MLPAKASKEENLALLQDALDAIHEKRCSDLTYEKLYGTSFHLVQEKCVDEVYEMIINTSRIFMRENKNELVSANGLDFMKRLRCSYEDNLIFAQRKRDICMPIETEREKNGLSTIFKSYMETYFGEAFTPNHVKIQNLLLNIFERARTGNNDLLELRDASTIIKMLKSMESDNLPNYYEFFEYPFLDETEKFYTEKATKFLKEDKMGPEQFIEAIDRIKNEENDRIERYLEPATATEVLDRIDKVCLQDNVMLILLGETGAHEKGAHYMIQNDKISTLRKVFANLSRFQETIPTLEAVLCSIFEDDAKSYTIERPDFKKIKALYAIVDRLENIIKEAFDNNKVIMTSFQKTLQEVLNKDVNAPAYLAQLIDETMKQKDSTEKEIENDLRLFVYLKDKDKFEAVYKVFLEKRLLCYSMNSTRLDLERFIVSKLKAFEGVNYTRALEGMFKDMDISSDCMQKLKESNIEIPSQLGEFRILTKNIWPTNNPINCKNLPGEVLDLFDAYAAFYVEKHNGRKLQPNLNYGTADLEATFYTETSEGDKPVRKTLVGITTLQLIVLLCFNHRPSYTFEELRQVLEIPADNLKRVMTELSCSKKMPVLIRRHSGGAIESSDIFEVNNNLAKEKQVRIKVPTSKFEVKFEIEKAEEEVFNSRCYTIEAKIVRVMKMRQQYTYDQLINEVTEHLLKRFVPEKNVIKSRVEILIEKGYIKRDDSDHTKLIYIA